jgi:hypothetical protein
MIRILLIIFCISIVGGCASIPEQNKLIDPETDLTDQGVVVFEFIPSLDGVGLPPGITIVGLNNDIKISSVGKKFFSLKLPAGKYYFSKIAKVMPKDPEKQNRIEFEVKRGKVHYIGSYTQLLGDKDLKNIIKLGKRKLLGKSYKYVVYIEKLTGGTRKIDRRTWTYFKVNNYEKIKKLFYKDYKLYQKQELINKF